MAATRSRCGGGPWGVRRRRFSDLGRRSGHLLFVPVITGASFFTRGGLVPALTLPSAFIILFTYLIQ